MQGRSVTWIILALCLAEASVTFESTMIYVALPTLIREFGDPVKAGWLVTSHMLIAAASAPVAGRLGDIMGRRRIVLVLLALALAGSLLSALTDNFGLILLGRALQGLSAAVLPLSIGVLRESVNEKQLPMGVGLMTTALGAGAALGMALGGVIVDQFGWKLLFVASAILLAMSILAVVIVVPDNPGTPTGQPIDWVEGLLPVPAVAAILFALGLTKEQGWLSPQVLGLIVGGAALMAYWARRSMAAREPFIDLRLFREHNFAVANAITVLLSMGTMQVVMVFASYIQSPVWVGVGLGASATVAGFAKLPSNLTSFFAGPLSGWSTSKAGHRTTVIAGCLLGAAGWFAALSLPGALVPVILLLCVISFGTTMLNAAITNVIVDSAPVARTSEAIGSMSVVRGISVALGAQIIAVLLASDMVAAPGGGASYPSPDAYRLTMGWIAALTTGAAIIGLLLRRKAR